MYAHNFQNDCIKLNNSFFVVILVPGYVNIYRYSTNALGRIYTVHPRNYECFYLRLLVNVPGPTSFQFLRNVNDELCATYREACERLHLLEDDVHWDR